MFGTQVAASPGSVLRKSAAPLAVAGRHRRGKPLAAPPGRVVLGPTAMLFLLLSLISIAFAAAAVPAPTQSSTQSQCEVALAAACAGSRGNAFTCATCAGKQHMKLQQAGCDNNMISRWCAGLPASEASVRAGSWNVYYKALDDPAGQAAIIDTIDTSDAARPFDFFGVIEAQGVSLIVD